MLRVGILGATGSVGQRFIELLHGGPRPHPLFQVTALGASPNSAGKPYSQAVTWKLSSAVPNFVADLVVQTCEVCNFIQTCDFVFSGLDSSVAGSVESSFADAGLPVFSNSTPHRTDPFVPVLIPFVNPEHAIVKKNALGGFIVTNSNCSTAGLCMALMPLVRRFGISAVFVATLQAVSGSGYPGLPFQDVYDNVVPFIGGEEPKIEAEPNKVFGDYKQESGFVDTDMKISAHCHRVPVMEGHQLSVSVKLKTDNVTIDDVLTAFRDCPFPDAPANSSGLANMSQLPSSPSRPILLRDECDRPQPRLDRMEGLGFTTVVGRVRTCTLYDYKFSVCSHNTVFGGAGGSVLNAEMLTMLGDLTARSTK